jgi:hypothetical protein
MILVLSKTVQKLCHRLFGAGFCHGLRLNPLCHAIAPAMRTTCVAALAAERLHVFNLNKGCAA